jgi:glycosyltransferase involved in cell wall biosynthesis
MDQNTHAETGGVSKKILILIVAFNAEKTIENVLARIPPVLCRYNYEILIIDDTSDDATFDKASVYKSHNTGVPLTVLYNPESLGYGGNQKLGFRYALDNKFDAVALIHGDGAYPPEILEGLIGPVLKGEADAVFGSRMMGGYKPVIGGMPLYKYAGNRILTFFQNKVLHMDLTEFHSGYRVYSVEALKGIPFELNTNDFHFDTEVIIQLKIAERRICEVPVPSYCSNRLRCLNGFTYAWHVVAATVGVKFHQINIFYQRQFDIVNPRFWYPPKLDFVSSHSVAINAIAPGSRVLDIGCGAGYIGRELEKRGCTVAGIDIATEEKTSLLQRFKKIDLNTDAIPFPIASFDTLLVLDVLEHLDLPSQFRLLEKIRNESRMQKPDIILTVPNVAFLPIRLQLLMGNFNYGKRGVLDMTHRHLYTFNSIRRFLRQSGFKIETIRGIPAPYPLAIGRNFTGRFLLRLNSMLIRMMPGLFSYQIFIKATPLPTVAQLLERADEKARQRLEANTPA